MASCAKRLDRQHTTQKPEKHLISQKKDVGAAVLVPFGKRNSSIIRDGQVNVKMTGLAFMTVEDFRRLALALEGAEESSHMGAPDFRVGGRIFATLASQSQGYGNLMLTPEQQAVFVEELPAVFLPVSGGWGRMGATHIRLSIATEEVLAGALLTAWKLRRDKNALSKSDQRRSGKAGRFSPRSPE